MDDPDINSAREIRCGSWRGSLCSPGSAERCSGCRYETGRMAIPARSLERKEFP